MIKESGNPYYQSFDDIDSFKKRCELEDRDAYEIMFNEETAVGNKSKKPSILFVSDTEATWEEIMDIREYLINLESEEKDEIEYRTKDSIRKFQIDYDKSVCLSEKFPEAFCNERNSLETIDIAPGEGKLPENILCSENWDALAFPMKHPDGKSNLHYKRKVKLSDQYYFVQRLRNKDSRFRNDPSYLFAAAGYLEKKQLQRNINVSFLRGTKTVSNSGENVYSLQDGFSVFDSTSNTPTYWKKAKYEIMAKLDNFGPFQFFFTLSCADKLWNENITSILEERNIRISYGFDINGNEETQVGAMVDGVIKWVTLEDYLENHLNETFHEILRRNVVTATRNYNHRVKSFINEVMMHKSNPMSVEYFSAKLEFQGRGAAHNHGVLWVNMNDMEFMIESLDDKKNTSPIEYNISKLNSILEDCDANYTQSLKDAICLCKDEIRPKTYQNTIAEEQAKKVVIKFGEEKLNIVQDKLDRVLSKFPFVGLTSAFKKFQSHEELTSTEETAVLNFANKFTSVSLCPSVVGKEVVEIVQKVNQHRHTKACRKYDTNCRFSFPKYPVWKTLIAKPNSSISESEKAKFDKILKDVKDILLDSNLIHKIMSDYDKNSESQIEYTVNREIRIKRLLAKAGYDSEEDFELYLKALAYSKSGFSIILQRDIDEIFVNSYNPEWILAWNGNIDLQICLDFFAVITYITEYFIKDDTGTMEYLMNALKTCENQSLRDKMTIMMNTFITHRQIGEAEVVYKIFPDFHFKDSNITTVFIPNCPREERSKFLIRIDDKPQYANIPSVKVENREGNFIEKYDIVSKYQRRVGLDLICAAQFTKMYEPSWIFKEESENQKHIVRDENNKFHFVMTSDITKQGEYLPKFIKLNEPFPAEPPFMRKRKSPAALRFHKINGNQDPKKYFFSECLLYIPFHSEEEIWERLNKNYGDLEKEIRKVKCQVMEYLESTEEARLFVEESLKSETVANELDPEGEQEKADCEIDGQTLHPDFEHLNPDDLTIQEEKKTSERQFKLIEIEERSILLEKTRKLDYYQKKVVEKGIRYARNLVKSIKAKNSIPEAIATIVMGGAGSGKSTVISVLKQWIHLILRKEGDNPDHPYVIVVAPTGTAAANVKGQTLHSTFSFNFGNKHYSLADKKRDKTRTLLQNLSVVIIDEISMVGSDMLYQLDLRLREIKKKENKLFGGVSVFFLGDIMQLRPCKGAYIFDEPLNKDYILAHMCKKHWEAFDVILLEENHRQGEDHDYAESLNRIRVGEQTVEDMEMLRTRVRPEGHPDLKGAMYITCTNRTVINMNEVRLNELDRELLVIKAKHLHPTIKDFRPKVDNKGTVGGTAFLETLKIKVGSRVMLIHNINVLDGLCNGARGELKSVEKDCAGNVIRLIIKFDEDYQGAEKRSNNPQVVRKYPGCTPIEKYLCSYSLAKKTTVASNTAQVFQFPVVVCFAATTHKFQGGTIHKPNKLAADLRTVFDDAMAYVMLSRVQAKKQLFIVGSLPVNKFKTSNKCLEELKRLSSKSVNKNPSKWEQHQSEGLKVFVLNCHSLQDKILDIKSDEMIRFSDAICLLETWVKDDSLKEHLGIDGYTQHLNSFGEERGKGLAIYYKSDIFEVSMKVKSSDLQVSCLSSPDVDIIVVYRSSSCRDTISKIHNLIKEEKTTIICGDFNVCYRENNRHSIIQSLHILGFDQKVKTATHLKGGTIDHCYFKNGNQRLDIDVQLYSPYYTALDHDALCVTLTKELKVAATEKPQG